MKRTMKTNVKTNVGTNVGLMFWACWPAGGASLGQPGGAQPGQPQSSPATSSELRLAPWTPRNCSALCIVFLDVPVGFSAARTAPAQASQRESEIVPLSFT